jgi:hypothetical protein
VAVSHAVIVAVRSWKTPSIGKPEMRNIYYFGGTDTMEIL